MKPGKPLVANGKSDKNRPQWRIPVQASGRKDATFPGYRSRFGDGVGRRQCVAMTRAGKRCRCDPLQGGTRCRLHGGHVDAYRTAGVTVSKATLRRPRKALAVVGLGPVPEGFPTSVRLPVSPVERGRLFESWRNRDLAPDAWLAMTEGS